MQQSSQSSQQRQLQSLQAEIQQAERKLKEIYIKTSRAIDTLNDIIRRDKEIREGMVKIEAKNTGGFNKM